MVRDWQAGVLDLVRTEGGDEADHRPLPRVRRQRPLRRADGRGVRLHRWRHRRRGRDRRRFRCRRAEGAGGGLRRPGRASPRPERPRGPDRSGWTCSSTRSGTLHRPARRRSTCRPMSPSSCVPWPAGSTTCGSPRGPRRERPGRRARGRLLGRGAPLDTRVDGLERRSAARADASRTPSSEQAARVVERAGARLRLSAEHTVVALAGATGSGKSSTFNALAGPRSGCGRRTPPDDVVRHRLHLGRRPRDAELLEWLEIPPRHRVSRDSMLDRAHHAGARRPRAARPARPRLHRGGPPPRGGPARRPDRPDGLGARSPEVRRRGDPPPVTWPPWPHRRRDACGAQPHRRGVPAGRAPGCWPTYDACSTSTDWATCRCSPPRRARVRGSTSCAARSASGSRTRQRPGPASPVTSRTRPPGSRPRTVTRSRATSVPGASRPGRRARRLRRGADRRGGGAARRDPPGPSGHRLAAHGVGRRGCGPTPCDGCTSTGAPRGGTWSPRRARRCPRRTTCSRRGWRRRCATCATRCPGVCAQPWVRPCDGRRRRGSRPRRPARPGGQHHRPRSRGHAGVVPRGARAAVGAVPRGPRRWPVARWARGDAATCRCPRRARPTTAASRVPTLMLVRAWSRVWGWRCCRESLIAVGRGRGPGGPTRRCARRSTAVCEELVVEPVVAELSAYRATWEGLRAARADRFASHRPPTSALLHSPGGHASGVRRTWLDWPPHELTRRHRA